jgi:hypothetical protein
MELLELNAVHDTGDGHEGGTVAVEESVTLVDGLYLYAYVGDYDQEVSLHIPREEWVKLVPVLTALMEETKPALPTLPHATIKAVLKSGNERVLTLVEPYREPSWVAHDEGASADWFESDDIVSFEVLFPGVES